MAATPTINLQWNNPLLYQNNLIQGHIPFHPFKIRTSLGKLRAKCFFIGNIRGSDASIAHLAFNTKASMNSKTDQIPVGFVVQTVIKALKAFQKPAAAAVLVGLLLMCDPVSAMAASGGRMGGSSFSSRSSMSSSRSYSTPRMGEGSGFSYSVPYYAPSPFSGVYVGPAVGFGSSFFPIMLAVAAFVLVSGFLTGDSESSVLADTEKTTVLKLQVGLLGLGRSLQKDLNRIAELADTSNSEGLHYVLTETILSLLRHPEYCISAHSSVDMKKSIEEGERRFNQLSIEERGKFDEETLVNVNNIKKQRSTILSSSGFSNEYIVITVVVAAVGVHKLSSINSSKDLKEALQKLASIPSSRILAVEVLWTPQNEGDMLSERELLEDYPLLRPL
ncbi:FLUCTUATING-LIGHT-ACCLIMATION protein 1, chloroplastic [Primulina huaijiensis]|uniref:FLUCTUATING-LIGHT-ACCLIMATION protein 1, chloroplastic n=1 Tax=Primulina huaijiensis TaxID=1492673 RepID=UPI003CC76391